MIVAFLNLLIDAIKYTLYILSFFLPSVILVLFMTHPHVEFERSITFVKISNKNEVHEAMPLTRHEHLISCGARFNEHEEFKKALSCVNNKTFAAEPIEEPRLPRCFIVSAASPDVNGMSEVINVIPLRYGPYILGAFVGLYEPDDHTIYVVDNEDANQIYRHELQHYFLHVAGKSNDRGNARHDHPVWTDCEAPQYSPSDLVKAIKLLKDGHKTRQPKI